MGKVRRGAASQTNLFDKPAEKPTEREWPVCVICGSSEGHAKLYVQSMYELAPGVSEGVVHERCLTEHKRKHQSISSLKH
jgi:hypothetical protein